MPSGCEPAQSRSGRRERVPDSAGLAGRRGRARRARPRGRRRDRGLAHLDEGLARGGRRAPLPALAETVAGRGRLRRGNARRDCRPPLGRARPAPRQLPCRRPRSHGREKPSPPRDRPGTAGKGGRVGARSECVETRAARLPAQPAGARAVRALRLPARGLPRKSLPARRGAGRRRPDGLRRDAYTATVTGLVHHYGLIALFLIVMFESGGVPLPGETALVAAAIYASQGKLNIVEVIAVAAAAAIIGDNLGYWIGRTGGRRVLERFGPIRRWSERVPPWSERFFARHGSKTIFIARFFSVLRVTAAWLAGISRMHWWTFFLWNAAGGICWAALVGLVAYYVGHAAADAIGRY